MNISKEKIQLIMAKKAWSYKDLADAYGVTKSRIGMIINSKTVRPITVGKIARALGVDVTEILED